MPGSAGVSYRGWERSDNFLPILWRVFDFLYEGEKMENQDLATILLSQATVGDPIRYANLVRATKSPEIKQIREMLPVMKEQLEKYERTSKSANEFRKQVSGDGYARRRKESKNIFGSLDQQKDQFRGIGIDVSVILSYHYDTVVRLYNDLVRGAEYIANARIISFDESMKSWSNELNASSEELGGERVNAFINKLQESGSDALQSLAMEQQINRGASTSFMQGLAMLERVPKIYTDYLQVQARNFEAYYERLRHRHSNEGMILCEYGDQTSAALTDVAIMVWENIDKVGEIESGHAENELSAYTLHRANAMIEAAKHGEVWPWLTRPGDQLLSWAEAAKPTITSVLEFVKKVKQMLGEPVWRLLAIDLEKSHKEFVDVVDSLDLNQITQRPPERAFSKTERFALEHRNKSVQKVANLITTGEGLQNIVDEILKLKIEEHQFFVHENSFYVCRIGTGNMFTGEAPGSIEVIPGEKPHASLDHIWGTGFSDIREFIGGMDDARKWNPLFLATSPSGGTDKNNVLLVGPQGCGKTQVMRALGADNESIAIFAVGSDFLTCWLGEAQKNPKRLFDEAVKLHKSSGRPVHILIDEIDMVLNDDRTSGSRVNLSLEFQNLMDGVVAYPGISIWGATNHPQRIPTPMLRRFAKVMVVGELDDADTISILKHYIEYYLPCEGSFEEHYKRWAKKLDGSTGDVLRKAVDEVWLNLMRRYVTEYKEQADEVLEFINTEYGDNFEISDLTDEDREKIKGMIGNSLRVTPESVDVQIANLLDNFAVQQQITVAKDTYKNAKILLARQKAAEKGLGF